MAPLHLTLLVFGLILSSHILSILGVRYLPRLNLVDFPGSESHKHHLNPVPLGGGLIIFTLVLLLKLFFNEELDFLNLYFFGAATIIFILGLWDDMHSLKPKIKLIGQIVSSLIIFLGGYRVELFNISVIDGLITFIWIIGIINSFNLLDGGDGLATGIVIIITFSLSILSLLISMQENLFLASIAVCAICMGIYINNKRPAKIFLGDSGAQLLGLILSVFALYFAPVGYYRSTSWIVPILIFLLPIFDVTLVVYSRIKRKVPVFQGGLDHTYHRLLARTRSHESTSMIIFFSVFILNVLSLITLIVIPFFGFLIFFTVMLLFIIIINKMESSFLIHGNDHTR